MNSDKIYTVHIFKFGLYIKSLFNLNLEEAYEICFTQNQELTTINKWYLEDKDKVINYFLNDNSKDKLLVLYKENNHFNDKINSENNMNKLKYIQEYYIEKQN